MTDWGSVPEWVAAVGTAGALLVGGWLLLKELREFRLIEKSRETEDAKKVSGWWKWEVGGNTFSPSEGHWIKVQHGYWLHLRNGSGAPIYDCEIRLVVPSDETLQHHGYIYPLIAPGETYPSPVPSSALGLMDVEYPLEPAWDAWVEVTFTDPEGRRWQRGEKGKLEELPE